MSEQDNSTSELFSAKASGNSLESSMDLDSAEYEPFSPKRTGNPWDQSCFPDGREAVLNHSGSSDAGYSNDATSADQSSTGLDAPTTAYTYNSGCPHSDKPQIAPSAKTQPGDSASSRVSRSRPSLISL